MRPTRENPIAYAVGYRVGQVMAGVAVAATAGLIAGVLLVLLVGSAR
jgi:tetrahydromethanopterin S-methyltransferase subunit F